MNYTPELGQMAFGNKYESSPTPGYITAGIQAIDLLYAVKVEGQIDQDGYVDGKRTGRGGGESIVNEVFALRPYWWGDCNCGFADHSLSIEYEILDQAGIDYESVEWDFKYPDNYHDEWLKRAGEFTEHKPDCGVVLPNFEHFASGLKAYWYKHSHRGETYSGDIDFDTWRQIQRECEDWIDAQPKPYRVLVTGSREWGSELYEYPSGPNPNAGFQQSAKSLEMSDAAWEKKKRYQVLRNGWYDSNDSDLDRMKFALRNARREADGRLMVIIEGGAKGADQLAGLLAEKADNARSEVYQADWNNCTGKACTPGHRRKNARGDYCPTAGFDRNQRMVDDGADICLAFFKKGAGNRGTSDCVRRAKAAGIEVVEVWSE